MLLPLICAEFWIVQTSFDQAGKKKKKSIYVCYSDFKYKQINSTCMEDRGFLHNISDLMLHRARLYEEQSKAFRHLLEPKQDV